MGRELKNYEALRLKHYLKGRKDRALYYRALRADKKMRDSAFARAGEDVIFFINAFGWAQDPRNQPFGVNTLVPFILLPKQIEYIQWLNWHYANSENGLTEKSRDEGMSWIWILWSLQKWLFKDGFKAGFGSYKDNKLDHRGDMDSLFEKFRFASTRLYMEFPELKPKGFKWDFHDNNKRIYNPANGSAVTGEVGGNIGRGGRTSIYFVDEHASLADARAVENSLSQTSNCIIKGSTPKGTNNLFYKNRMEMPDRNIFIFDWRDNPLKTEQWYADQTAKFDEVTIAQEIDRDYTASVEGVVIPAKWVNAAIELVGPAEERGKRNAGLDMGTGSGKSESVYISRIGPKIHRIETRRSTETTDFALTAIQWAEADDLFTLYYDAVGVGAHVGGTIKHSYRMARRKCPFKTYAVLSGNSASYRKLSDAPKLTARDRFSNLRAELWWGLRLRFQKSWEIRKLMSNKNVTPEEAAEELGYELSDAVSIPNDNELKNQLSQPTWSMTGTGKIKIESKDEMLKRGIKSPDRADALVYMFSPMPPVDEQVQAPVTASYKTM